MTTTRMTTVREAIARIIILGVLLLCFQRESSCFGGYLDPLDINIAGKTYAYLQSNPNVEGEKNYFGETRINLTCNKTFNRSLFFKFSPLFQLDTDHKSQGVINSFTDNDQHRRILDLDEGFIEHRLKKFDYFIGKRIFSWGKGDNFNPSDKINPKDYTDFLDSQKMGVFSGGLKLYPDTGSQLEAYVIPFFTRSRIYLTDSRWAAPSPKMPLTGAAIEIKEDIPAEAQYALRYSLYLPNLDIDMIYMRRIEDLPTLLIKPSAGLLAPPTILETYRKMDLFSIEGSTTMADRFELHGGATYHDIDKQELYGRFIHYLLGVNYTFDGRVLFNKSLKLSAEYSGAIDVDKPLNEDLIALDFVRVFENSLFTKISSTLTDFSDLEIGNLYSFEKPSNDILRIKYTYSYNDRLELSLGADFIWGDGELIFEQFEKNDRTWANIKLLF